MCSGDALLKIAVHFGIRKNLRDCSGRSGVLAPPLPLVTLVRADGFVPRLHRLASVLLLAPRPRHMASAHVVYLFRRSRLSYRTGRCGGCDSCFPLVCLLGSDPFAWRSPGVRLAPVPWPMRRVGGFPSVHLPPHARQGLGDALPQVPGAWAMRCSHNYYDFYVSATFGAFLTTGRIACRSLPAILVALACFSFQCFVSWCMHGASPRDTHCHGL